MKKVLKNKNFALLFSGAFVSEIGNMVFALGMSVYILLLTDDALLMSIFMAVSVFSRVLVSPIAGPLVDRWNRIRVIYITDFIRGITFLVLAYLFFNGLKDTNTIIFYLFVVTIISSINAAFFFPAASSSIPDIVGEENLQAAQGLQGFLLAIPQLIGGFLGAAFVDTIGVEWIILLNGVSFALSGLSEMFIKTPYKKEFVLLPKDERNSIFQDYKESLIYAKKVGVLSLVGFFLVINFAVTPLFSVATPVLFKLTLARANTMEFAATGAAFSVAAMIGSIVVGSIKLKSYKSTIKKGVFMLFVLFGTNVLLFYLVEFGHIQYWWFYGLYIANILVIGINLSYVNLPISVGLTVQVEPEMRGRVFSTVGAIAQLAVPFSMLFGGLMIKYTSVAMLGFGCLIIMVVPTIGFLKNKNVNDVLDAIDISQAKLADQQ